MSAKWHPDESAATCQCWQRLSAGSQTVVPDGGGNFVTLFQSWLRNRMELSFAGDPQRHGTMLYGGHSLLDRAVELSSAYPVAKTWSDAVRRFAEESGPFGYFFKVDWHHGGWEKLTIYCRFKNGSTSAARLARTAHDAGLWWPVKGAGLVRDETGTEPFLVGIRTGLRGELQLAVYHALKPAFSRLTGDVVPAVAPAGGLTPGQVATVNSDLTLLHEPEPFERLGMELGVQSRQHSDDVRCTFYLREVGRPRVLRFVESTDPAASPHLAAMTEHLPGGRFLYVGVRYGSTGRMGWKLYALLRPVRPLSELNLSYPPTPELLRDAYVRAPSGVAL